jgi:hypothetical protein
MSISLFSFSNLLNLVQHSEDTQSAHSDPILSVSVLSGFVFWKLALTWDILSVEFRKRFLSLVLHQFKREYLLNRLHWTSEDVIRAEP